MKHCLSIALLFACFGVPPGIAAQSSTPQQPSVAVAPNIHELYVEDQADRTGQGGDTKHWSDVNSRDAARRLEAMKLLAAGELKTAQDFHDAAFIFQHGHNPDDYLLAHILAMEAMAKGDASSRWIAAATLDRYLQAIGQKQVFGTQYLNRGYMYLLQHKNDPAAMQSAEAHEKGNTQEPYDRTLLPDSLRNDFCVPNQAVQAANLSELDAGRPMTVRVPPGCGN